MKRTILQVVLATVGVCLTAGSDWRQFRGTDNTSVSDETGLPTTFDTDSGRNVAWKIELPGKGPSSPIIVGGRVIVTAATGPKEDRLHVLCFDAASGKPRWHQQLWATGSTVANGFGGVATPTPASDGQRIFALFSSSDLACFDLDGNLRWYRALGYECPTTRNDVGMGSSPLVIGRTVIVQLQNQGESFVAGLDALTGETRWRIERSHDAIWSSPTVLRGEKPVGDVLLLHGRTRLSAHDPQTGKQLWDYEAGIDTIGSVTTCGRAIYLPAFGLHGLRSEPDGRSVKPLWYQQRLRVDSASPVARDGRVYFLKPPGILVCCNTDEGKVLWQLRLKGPNWATPVLAGGHLYVVNYEGLVQVVALGDEGKLIGTSRIDNGILASPAVADGAIYFRSNAHLWKVAAPRN